MLQHVMSLELMFFYSFFRIFSIFTVCENFWIPSISNKMMQICTKIREIDGFKQIMYLSDP